jgi:hypothetical protein
MGDDIAPPLGVATPSAREREREQGTRDKDIVAAENSATADTSEGYSMIVGLFVYVSAGMAAAYLWVVGVAMG